jgi:hypothetical protein
MTLVRCPECKCIFSLDYEPEINEKTKCPQCGHESNAIERVLKYIGVPIPIKEVKLIEKRRNGWRIYRRIKVDDFEFSMDISFYTVRGDLRCKCSIWAGEGKNFKNLPITDDVHDGILEYLGLEE